MINAFQSLFNHFNRANLSPLASPRNTKPDSSPERSPVQKTPETVTPRVKSLTADGSPATGNQTWGPPRTVELEREQGKSLGISIVGQCLLYITSGISVGASYCGWFQNKYIHFMQFLFDESKDIIKQVRSKFLHAHIIPSHNLFKKMKGVSSYTQF